MTHRKPKQILKEVLLQKGVTQVQAAFDLGIPRTRFNLIANGWECPSPEIRKKISRYIGRPEHEIFDIRGIK